MRILFFATYFKPYISGITVYPDKLLQFLSKKNQVRVLCFKHAKDLANEEKFGQVTVERMPFLFKLSKGFISLRSFYYFFQRVRTTDVVMLNIPNAEGLPLAMMARLMGKKVISIFHCQVYFDQGLVRQILAKLLQISVRLQLCLSNQIIAYTQDYVQSLNWSQRLMKKTQYVLPPVGELAVDEEYLSELKNKKNQEIWVGFVGRIAEEKGLDVLAQAVEELKHQNKKLVKSLKMALVGPFGEEVVGEASYYQKLKKTLDELGINYEFFGLLTGGKLGAFYQIIDVLVLPSVNQTEAFGMVQVEALQAGKPVIAANLPGVRVPVKMTGHGEIVEPSDEKDLAGALVKVLAEKKNKGKGKNFSELFDQQQTFAFYEELLGGYL